MTKGKIPLHNGLTKLRCLPGLKYMTIYLSGCWGFLLVLLAGHACAGKVSFESLRRLSAWIQDERDGGGNIHRNTQALICIYLLPPYLIFSYTFLLFPVDAYTFQSLKKRENVIFQNMLFIFIIFLSFLVCFVTCTIFSICLNLSSMSAWISVLQSFVAVL